MKIRTCAALLIAAMMLVLTGCGLRAAGERLDAVEEAVEIHLEAAEEAAETAVREVLLPKPEPLPQEPATLAVTSTPAATEAAVPATEPAAAEAKPVDVLPPAPSVHTAKLTQEEAQSIALKHAGFTKDQVSYLRAEYDIDDRIPEYDIEFREGQWEYEYEIHAETGTILSFEKDD